MNCDTVELIPNPAFLMQSMRHIGYTLETALADIIDNSIAADASCISIQYRWNDLEPWIAIIDDGCGMTKEGIKEAMRFGGELCPAESRSPNDLGRFGLGLKTASLSQCRRLTVISKRDDAINSCVWDVDSLTNLPDPQWTAFLPPIEMLNADPVIAKLMPRLESVSNGTIVLWQKLDNFSPGSPKNSAEHNFSDVLAHSCEHMGLVFHRFFAMEKGSKVVRIDFNGTPVEAVNPFGIAVPARQELPEETIIVNGQDIVIQPFVLPHSSKVSKQDYERFAGDGGYLHNQGFYVYRNRRLIIKGTWFRIISKTELTKLLRVRIDIPNSLDHLWQLDVKKSHASPPLAVLTRLRELLPALAFRGKRPYTNRGNRAISDKVHIWRREFTNGKVSYVINEEHPFVKNLVTNENGDVDLKKLSFLRIISGAFPSDSFHVDVNSDTQTVIVPIAQQEEMERAVRELINSCRNCGMSKESIFEHMTRNELFVSGERLEELITEEFHG